MLAIVGVRRQVTHGKNDLRAESCGKGSCALKSCAYNNRSANAEAMAIQRFSRVSWRNAKDVDPDLKSERTVGILVWEKLGRANLSNHLKAMTRQCPSVSGHDIFKQLPTSRICIILLHLVGPTLRGQN